MNRFIARLNIDHFKRMLAAEGDPARREALVRLIGEEETKLRQAEQNPGATDIRAAQDYRRLPEPTD